MSTTCVQEDGEAIGVFGDVLIVDLFVRANKDYLAVTSEASQDLLERRLGRVLGFVDYGYCVCEGTSAHSLSNHA